MGEESRKILQMLSKGKIGVDEAERLLKALGTDSGAESGGVTVRKPKYLRVLVEPVGTDGDQERVNIRVPVALLRAGLKLASLIPEQARSKVDEALKEKGIEMDLSKIKSGDLDEIIANLNDLQVEVDGKERVRVFCE